MNFVLEVFELYPIMENPNTSGEIIDQRIEHMYAYGYKKGIDKKGIESLGQRYHIFPRSIENFFWVMIPSRPFCD